MRHATGLILASLWIVGCGGSGGGGAGGGPCLAFCDGPAAGGLATMKDAGPAGPDLATIASCSDGKLDGDESDIDCGGSCPTRCDDGKTCLHGSDCKSADCINNRCATATCT